MEPKGTGICNCWALSFRLISQLYPGDRAHRMPIITPAYPAMCATPDVTASTQMVMTEELKKGATGTLADVHLMLLPGANIVDKVIVGTADWAELFTKHNFFRQYRYYLQIVASTGDHDLQRKW